MLQNLSSDSILIGALSVEAKVIGRIRVRIEAVLFHKSFMTVT